MYNKEHQRLLSTYKKENKQTKEEQQVEEILKDIGVHYISQKGFVAKCNTCLIADFYLPKPHKLIIEVDGGYHNNRVEQDKGRDLFFLHERNIRTLRIKNEELINLPAVKQKIMDSL